jgi:hypothetical protein
MPLLRRSSSRKKSSENSEGGGQAARPSLFQRLSRRSSQEHVQDTAPPTAIVKPEQKSALAGIKTSQPVKSPSPELSTEDRGGEASVADGLSKEDVRALFFGAPHFMLEKGRHGKFASYPF